MPLGGLEAELLLIGRILFGGVLAYMGLNHFVSLDDMAGYAEYKGIPAPKVGVLVSGLVLIAGGIGVIIGLFPTLSALALAGFLILAAVLFHDFWAVPDEQQQDEMINFLKNVALAGAALAIAAVGLSQWEYAVGVGLF